MKAYPDAMRGISDYSGVIESYVPSLASLQASGNAFVAQFKEKLKTELGKILYVQEDIKQKDNPNPDNLLTADVTPETRNPEPVTVFVPVYNEENILKENVERLAAYLDKNWPDYEILIASNGSTDGTVPICEALHRHNPRVAYFHLPEKGVGAAFEEGLKRAACDRIVTVDADLTTDMDFIPRAAQLLDDYEIVVGSKKNGHQKRSVIRIAGSGSFIFCVRRLLGLPYVDYSIGSKAYQRSTIIRYAEHIDYGSSYVIEIIYRAWRHGCSIIEIPVFCEDTRESKFNLLHEGVYRFSNLFRLWIKR